MANHVDCIRPCGQASEALQPPLHYKLAAPPASALDPRVTKTEYILRELRFKLWLKPSIVGIAAVGWLSFAYMGADLLPEKLQFGVKRDILLNLLGILASTMLTVATFSVSAMVGAFSAVSTTATPRATKIVMGDSSSQNALTSFLAAFIYAIVALVALSILEYGNNGRLLLFLGYVIMVIWVLVSFVRWVDRISNLGRMGDTLEHVEKACEEAFSSKELAGSLGGAAEEGGDPGGTNVFPDRIGYIQNIDIARLQEIATELKTRIRVRHRPGAFVDKRDALVSLRDPLPLDDEMIGRIREAFQMGDARSIEGDPRFGLIVLAEIADRALSPAVNDPGTAIGVIGIQIRLLEKWSCHRQASPEIRYPAVEVPSLDPEDLLDDAFTAISRDGAAMFEVGARLQKCFATLAGLNHAGLREAAFRHSGLALEQAEKALATEYHRTAIRKLAAEVIDDPNSAPTGTERV